jgi:hypothetical protein
MAATLSQMCAHSNVNVSRLQYLTSVDWPWERELTVEECWSKCLQNNKGQLVDSYPGMCYTQILRSLWSEAFVFTSSAVYVMIALSVDEPRFFLNKDNGTLR